MILIKYATRGRAEWFKKTIQNITNTIDTKDYKILVSSDFNDATMNTSEMFDFCEEHEKIMFVLGASTSKVSAINRDMELSGNWDMLVNMSDDMQFTVDGWDRKMKEKIAQKWIFSTDYFAHFNDGYTKDALPTMSVMGRKYYERFGYIYHPDYKSFSCDAEAMYVAMMLGRYCYFSDVYFLHQHPTNTPISNDETYRINSLHTPHDVKVYWQRLNNYFDVPEAQRLCVPFQEYIGRYE